MFGGLRDWWVGVRVIRLAGRARRKVDHIEKEFSRAVDRIVDFDERLREEIDSHKKLLSRSEEALDTARAELRVAEKTIESLVASNKLLTDRWDAESAIQTYRRVAASSKGMPE